MRRGTTPTITISCDGTTLATGWTIYLTVENGECEITKTGNDLTITTEEGKTIIETKLTQQETLGFRSGTVANVQLRAIDAEGTAVASSIVSVSVDEILHNGQIAAN